MPHRITGIDVVARRVISSWNLVDRSLEIPSGYMPCPCCTAAFRFKNELETHCFEDHPSLKKQPPQFFAMDDDRAIGIDLIEILDRCAATWVQNGEVMSDQGKSFSLNWVSLP